MHRPPLPTAALFCLAALTAGAAAFAAGPSAGTPAAPPSDAERLAAALGTAPSRLAEVIRGGLQAIPKGQIEAAATLGLSYWQTQYKIVLPQALAMVVPSIMNNFISLFKDTSLVTIVSLYELTGALGMALNSDANWRPFKIEGYLFIALIYFAFCFSMSRYSVWVEKQVNKGKAR